MKKNIFFISLILISPMKAFAFDNSGQAPSATQASSVPQAQSVPMAENITPKVKNTTSNNKYNNTYNNSYNTPFNQTGRIQQPGGIYSNGTGYNTNGGFYSSSILPYMGRVTIIR